MSKESVKVEGGKLVELRQDGETRLTGDFFLEPPEARRSIEEAVEEAENAEELERLLEGIEADFIGFSRQDVVRCYRKLEGETE